MESDPTHHHPSDSSQNDFNQNNLKFETVGQSLFEFIKRIRFFLFHPNIAFESLNQSKPDLTKALTFGLIVHWLASAISLLTQSMNFHTFEWMFREASFRGIGNSIFTANPDWLKKALWIFGTGSVLLNPIFTLIGFIFSGFTLFICARILIREKVKFETFLTVLSFASVSAFMGVIPFVDAFLAKIFSIVYQIIGIRSLLKIDTGKAILIVFLPTLLMFLIVVFFILILLFGIFKAMF